MKYIFLKPVWTLRIHGVTFWAYKHTCYLYVLMNGVFTKILDKFVLIFIDDILIYSKTL